MFFLNFFAREKLSQVTAFLESRIYSVWFLAMFLTYLSFSPLAIAGMGYMGENLEAAQQIASNLLHWVKGQSGQWPINWPRHGAVEMFFEAPLLLLEPLLPFNSSFPADRILSLQPVMMTSAISTIILKWSRRLTGSLKLAIAVTLSASFATMLWPYAYIGLETTQSLFLLLAGYLALNYEKPVTWPRTLVLALSAGVAASAKSNGLFLLPALGFLVCAYFWRDWQNYQSLFSVLKKEWAKASFLASIILMFYWVGSYSRSVYWKQHGSLMEYVTSHVLIESPITFLMNMWSQFFSINKGLGFFAPIAVAGLLAIRRTFRREPQLAYFSLLVLGGATCSLSLFFPWQDEVWGPRYLHSAVAPLALCLAAALRQIGFSRRNKALLFAATVFGLSVSFLGSIFYYGQLHRAATATGNSTLENLLNDPRFNHIRFNLKLAQCRVMPTNEQWPKPKYWWFSKPQDAPPESAVNLCDYSYPQSPIFDSIKAPRRAALLKLSLLLGVWLLGWIVWLGVKQKERVP